MSFFFSLLILSACGSPESPQAFIASLQPDFQTFQGSSPLIAQSSSSRAVTLWATWYNVHSSEHIDNGIALRSLDGKSLGVRVAHKDWCYAAMEGTVRVRQKNGSYKVYNYAGVSDSYYVDCSPFFSHSASGKVKFKESRGAFGEGVQNYLLRPFRSLATDPNFIPTGSVVYIPAAKGQLLTLPWGETWVHDGYFIAADVGGLIKGNHIDVFIGTSSRSPFSWIKSHTQGTFQAYIVSDANIKARLKEESTVPRCFDKNNRDNNCLRVDIPKNIVVGKNVIFSGIADDEIQSVRIEVDGWHLGTVPVNNYVYQLTYAFQESRASRKLVVKGLDARKNVVQKLERTIKVDSP